MDFKQIEVDPFYTFFFSLLLKDEQHGRAKVKKSFVRLMIYPE